MYITRFNSVWSSSGQKVFSLKFKIFWGSLIKVERKIVKTILWQSLSPVLQAPDFCREFGLFLSNTSNKVPLVVLR